MLRRARLVAPPVVLGLALGTGCNDAEPGCTTADRCFDPTEAGTDSDTGAGPDSDGDSDGEPTSGGEASVWDTPFCYGVADGMKWPEPWPTWEDEVVALVNEARAAGADCGSMGVQAPTHPLKMDASLRCAARVHSQDMAERDYFAHDTPEGQSPYDRILEAGYGSYAAAGENIAAGTDTPDATVDGWLASDGHCANIMNPNFDEIGVGAYEGPGHYVYYWTQTFGRRNPG